MASILCRPQYVKERDILYCDICQRLPVWLSDADEDTYVDSRLYRRKLCPILFFLIVDDSHVYSKCIFDRNKLFCYLYQ